LATLEAWAMDDKEFAKQMYTYADAITAFAFVQGTAFGLVMGQNGGLASTVASFWFFSVPIMVVMNVVFIFMVRQCHRSEDRLIGAPATRSDKIGAILPAVRKTRQWIICFVGMGEALLVLGERFYPPGLH
jgi:hypothetical protein